MLPFFIVDPILTDSLELCWGSLVGVIERLVFKTEFASLVNEEQNKQANQFYENLKRVKRNI